MTTAEMIDVMQAFERGETIEVTRKGLDLWALFKGNYPSWDWSFYEFRIASKPEPKKYRPFTAEEFKPHRDRWIRHKTDGECLRVSGYSQRDVLTIRGNLWSYAEIFATFVFDDTGEPCGMEVTK